MCIRDSTYASPFLCASHTLKLFTKLVSDINLWQGLDRCACGIRPYCADDVKVFEHILNAWATAVAEACHA
eukprot:5557158-Amphidinium_carterae.1